MRSRRTEDSCRLTPAAACVKSSQSQSRPRLYRQPRSWSVGRTGLLLSVIRKSKKSFMPNTLQRHLRHTYSWEPTEKATLNTSHTTTLRRSASCDYFGFIPLHEQFSTLIIRTPLSVAPIGGSVQKVLLLGKGSCLTTDDEPHRLGLELHPLTQRGNDPSKLETEVKSRERCSKPRNDAVTMPSENVDEQLPHALSSLPRHNTIFGDCSLLKVGISESCAL